MEKGVEVKIGIGIEMVGEVDKRIREVGSDLCLR